MKNLLLIVFLFCVKIGVGQIIYSWTPNVDPGWNSSNPSNSTLGYQSCYGYVSTSDCVNNPAGSWYAYDNSQITDYTSPTFDFECTKSNYITVNFLLQVYLLDSWWGNYYDWFYFQYSIDGGVTWVNPVNPNIINNGSGVNLSSYPPQTTWVNNNSNIDGWSGNVFVNQTFLIPNSGNNMFRFIFQSDNIINSANSNIYYVDILSFNVQCISYLPITLKSLTVKNEGNKNKIYWTTSSEQNNNYFIIEKSNDGVNYKEIGRVKGAENSSQELNYSFTDQNPYLGITYYRLTQVDFDGKSETFNPVSCEYSVNDTKVFPNPFKNEINIHSTFETYELYSNGKLVKFGDIKQRMDFSDLEVGVYSLVLKTENNIEVIKIVKK